MFDHNRRWDETMNYDWHQIKREWHKYWNRHKPILLEKSPPNLIRADKIELHFEPSYFIIFYRNPYAHCESLIRRRQFTTARAARFAINCLKYQKKNASTLKRSILISYESLTNNKEDTLRRLSEFLPELSDMDFYRKFTSHNFMSQNLEITNLNDKKIDKLTIKEIEEINSVFLEEVKLINDFGYEILTK